MRTNLGEVTFGLNGPTIAVHAWSDDHNTLVLGLGLVRLYLHIPTWIIPHYDMDRAYGFTFADTGLHVHFGGTRVFWYPWSWDHYKHWEVVAGGSYASGELFFIELPRRMNHGELATKNSVPYTYARKNGDIQKVTATYYVSRQEWRWYWFGWLSWPRKVSTSIVVEFSAEIGEGIDTWKGGTLGCGYELLPDETPLECLRRMERERKFSR